MNKRIYSFACIIWTIVFLVLGVFVLNFKEFKLLPIDQDEFLVGTYHEGIDTNYSKNRIHFEGDTAVLDYTLSTTYVEPFAALFIRKQNEGFIDISAFNSVSVDITSHKGSRIPIILTIDYHGFSNQINKFPRIHYAHMLEYKGPGKYEIPLSSFEISSWWLRHHNKRREDFNELDLTRVKYFIVESCKLLGNDDSDQIRVSEVTFFIDNTKKISYLVISWVTGIIVLLLILLYRNKKKMVVPYRSVSIQTESSKKDRVVAYISENYTNPKLTVELVENELGLAKREVGKILKESFDTSFKSYLNTIRLTEIKTLLLESNLSVSEIAYLVGYNSISHFNRIFKEQEGVSPMEFRENGRE